MNKKQTKQNNFKDYKAVKKDPIKTNPSVSSLFVKIDLSIVK